MANFDFNAEPYYDDFTAPNGALESNYMRILFRPGYAVQARELTQIQSIIQNQIKQFGNHIFQDGSPVVGGHMTLDTSAVYVKLSKQYQGVDIDLDNFIGKTVFNGETPRTRARVIQTFSNSTDRTIMVKYLRGADFGASQTITTAGAENVASANIVSSSATGFGSVASINEGVFYAGGFFVKVYPQTIVLDPYSTTPTYRVGLQIEEDIITESDDTMLLDPAQESFNYQAPGAHRYKFNLVLAKRALDSVDDSRFFELLRVENGVVTKQVNYPIYSELEKTLARRTYDESGNYVVKPFRINVTANTPANTTAANNSFIINVEPGKAYVNGFEYETIGTQRFSAARARTFAKANTHLIDARYGNSIEVEDLKGNTGGIQFSKDYNQIDIHCVDTASINLDGNTHKYYATTIGTARVKNIDYGGSEGVYALNLIDVNFRPIMGMSATNPSSLFNTVYVPQYFANTSNAYVGGTLTVLTGDAAGESRIITSYDPTYAAPYLSVDRDFSSKILGNCKFSITVPMTGAASIALPNTSTYLSSNLRANVSSDSKNEVGDTYLDDTNFNKNIFELPNYYVKYDGYDNVGLYRRIRKNISLSVDGSGSVGVNGSDEGIYDFGTTGSALSNATIREKIIVVVTSGTASLIGNVIDMTTGGRSITKVSDLSLTINTNSYAGTAYTVDVYVTTKVSNLSSVKRTKSLVSSNSEITVNDLYTDATSVIGYTDVKVNPTSGIAWYTSSSVIPKTPGERQSLFVSDVIKINKVYDSGSISAAVTPSNAVDITDRYTFDSGQNDNYYDHASIMLKPGSNPPAGQTAVLFDYFAHAAAAGYLAGESYPQAMYDSETIPLYKSLSGRVYNLRDCIDLRPIRDSGVATQPYISQTLTPRVNVASGGYTVLANTNLMSNVLSPPIVTGNMINVGGQLRKVTNVVNTIAVTVSTPFTSACTNVAISVVNDNKVFGDTVLHNPSYPLQLDYEYYLPRIDKVIATKDREIKILTGVPSLTPQEPMENENALPLYKVHVPAYTASTEAIDLEYIDNRRFTMKDISDIEERLTNLEEHVYLKESESEIINNPPKDSSGRNDKPIYGTLVDDFEDLSSADTSVDFSASIENGKLTTYKYTIPFHLIPADSSDTSIQDKFITLPYTEVAAVTQAFSTNNANSVVQSAVIGKFEGFVTLTPESDYYYSTEHQPAVTDTIGRYFQIAQNPVVGNPVFTIGYLNSIGAGQYYTAYYNGTTMLGANQPTSFGRVVRVPDYSVPATATEPSTTTTMPVTTSGATDVIDRQWFGTTPPIVVDTTNQFGTGYVDSSALVRGIDRYK